MSNSSFKYFELCITKVVTGIFRSINDDHLITSSWPKLWHSLICFPIFLNGDGEGHFKLARTNERTNINFISLKSHNDNMRY